MSIQETFHRHLLQPETSMETLALDIARIERPRIDAAVYLARIDALADHIARSLSPDLHGRAVASRVLDLFTNDLGFHGNQSDYYDPRNSCLDQVLDRRTGLPIMLCLLCMAIGQRLGLRIDGLGFPSHFMARYMDATGAWLLDPFYNAVVEVDHADAYLSSIVGRSMRLSPAYFEPVTALDLLTRILNNLRTAYSTTPQAEKLLQVVALQMVLTPARAPLWRERAVIQYHLQLWEEAAHDLRHYFSMLGALPYLFPEDARAAYELPELNADDRNLLVMHRRITEMLNRLN